MRIIPSNSDLSNDVVSLDKMAPEAIHAFPETFGLSGSAASNRMPEGNIQLFRLAGVLRFRCDRLHVFQVRDLPG